MSTIETYLLATLITTIAYAVFLTIKVIQLDQVYSWRISSLEHNYHEIAAISQQLLQEQKKVVDSLIELNAHPPTQRLPRKAKATSQPVNGDGI